MDRRQTLQWMVAASAALGAEMSAGATPSPIRRSVDPQVESVWIRTVSPEWTVRTGLALAE